MKLPSEFDPSVNLIARQEENGVFHSVVESAALAESLMRDSSEDQAVIVERIIAAVVVLLLAFLLPMPLLANERLATKDSYGRIYSESRRMGA